MAKLTAIPIFLLGCFIQSAEAQDWLAWRGPKGDGIVRGCAWNPEALKDGAKIRWRVDVGKGHSSVAVRGTRLWTMGSRAAKNPEKGENVICCLDARTGQALWRHAFACKPGSYPGPYSTPVVDGDRVYALSGSGHLHCLNAETGAVVWKRNLKDDGTIPKSSEMAASPLVYKTLLLLNLNTSGLALDKRTGETVWTSPQDPAGDATPVLFTYKGRPAVILPVKSHLHIVHAETGEVLWRSDSFFMQEPLFMGDRMFLFEHKKAVLYNLTGKEPVQTWCNPAASCQFQRFIRFGDHAYGLGKNTSHAVQKFYCIRLSDGEKMWEVDLDKWGSLIGAEDGHLIIIQGLGELVIARATPEGFCPVSRAQVMETRIPAQHDSTLLESHCWTNPVLANGFIYVRSSEGELVCVDMRSSL